METYKIAFEEKTHLYYNSQEIFSEETEEDFDTSFDELSELEIFEFNEKNYINAQNALEQEVVDYSSDENEEEFDNKLQTCGQIKNVRNICQLVGVWQIDENAVSEYQSKGIPLGHLNRRPGSADTETEEKKEIILASMLVPALKFLYNSSETPLKYEYYNPKNNTRYLNLNEFNYINDSINIDDSIKSLIEILPKLPSYFFLKLLLNINCIMDITQPKLDWTDDKWKEIGEKLGNEVWNSRKIVTDKKSEIQLPISLNAYYESFPNFLRGFFDGLIDVKHITKCVTFFASLIISMAFPYLGVWFTQVMAINPTERLIKGPNIWNLAVIDNIDFKEKSFIYRNIFDITCKSSHTTLRMAFQMWMLIPLEEKADDKKNITSPTAIHQKILENVDHGYSADIPNIVILETGRIPNSDEGIFRSTEMYKQDFNLGPDDYLNVVADEAIFRRLIKQRKVWPKLRPILGQWHTSKDMCGILIVLFSSYGIFDLAKVSGVKFLDKLDKIVDYHSTVRVLKLIWCAVTISIRIYMKKTNLNKYNIMDSNSGIRVGNYKLQKNALACFVGLFASAGKSNYSVTVTQYLGMLAQYPKLEEKLEFLETFEVKFIKQNITGNVVDDNKLKLQVKAA
ncbi:hypothetical protein C1646_770683 [Rhizophagus diaphanus]|nr:hypothetical protein C1646_770683 [Rhizophagus diaphanus] [Rhizophagus sp. MUCL 43196]